MCGGVKGAATMRRYGGALRAVQAAARTFSLYFFYLIFFLFLFEKKRAYYISVKIRLLTGKYKRVNKDIIKRLSGFIKANNAAKIKRI